MQLTQTVPSGRRRASVDRVLPPHSVESSTAFPTRRSLRVQLAGAPSEPLDSALPVPSDLPTRRQLRARSAAVKVPVTPPADVITALPTHAQRSSTAGATSRGSASRRSADSTVTPRGRLRDNVAVTGLVLASAGVLLAAMAPTAGTSNQEPTAGSDLTFASTVTAVAARASLGGASEVTAPAGADVTFGLESAGPATDGVAPSIVSARALSSSVSPTAKEREAFGLPVAGADVVSPFGYRVNPMGGSDSELHAGVDYASACGTDVVAADDGTVTESGWHDFGGGQRIVVDHGDGMKTTYNHMSVLGVTSGTTVSRGQLIGSVGSTGNSTGCHLHFEVMVNDEKVDPGPWL